MTMRVLAIGYALPDPTIDNYNVMTAPSYFDYDAVIVDPASITRIAHQMVDGGTTLEAFDGRPVINGPSSPTAVGAADQVRRRADETRRLLEASGTVIVFAHPNAVEPGLIGFEGCDRYSWLPAPAGLLWGPPYLRAAEGKSVSIVAEEHPLARLLRTFRNEVGYRAAFDDRLPELKAQGRTIAVGGSRVPIAMEFSVLGGRVIFIPAFGDFVGPVRSEVAGALVEACRRLVGSAPGEDAPWWTRSVAVPGLEQAEAELEDARRALDETQARVTAALEQHDTLAAYRRVIWADGIPFQQAVADSFRVIGFGVTGGGDEPLTLRADGQQVLLEAESDRAEIVEWPYVRLQRRLEQHLLKEAEQLRGIVVANGRREIAIESREEQVASTLRNACENYGYALLTGETLFAMVQRALGGASDDELGTMRRRLMRATGLVTTTAALGEVEEGTKDTGPIF
jgi:hypothetical protein